MSTAPPGRARRATLGLLAILLTLACLIHTGDRGTAAIPPTGPMDTTARLAVSRTGSLAVAETTAFDSYREEDLALGGRAHTGFRLPDRHQGPFPVYLRPSYHDATATLDGADLRLEAHRTGHAYVAVHPTQVREGPHRFVLRYRQEGGARTVDGRVELRWRPLSGGFERVVVRGPGVTRARCVTRFWGERLCGRVDGGVLVVDEAALRGADGADDDAQSLVIVADPAGYDLPAPHLDRD